ncbi:MAG: SIR2 family protein [Treponema sp.]|nr:SIR2 family protein [Treponema sp.]
MKSGEVQLCDYDGTLAVTKPDGAEKNKMSEIRQLKFSDSETKKLLQNLFDSGTLVPFIGSGFTKGFRCSSGECVPDGNILISMMRAELEKFSPEKARLVYEGTKFSKVAKYYLKYVPQEQRLKLFQRYFTGVNINDERKEFLLSGWAYIFTLNIDDGIERTLSDFEQILPYKPLNLKFAKTNRCIYKLHGDAKYEVKYPGQKNLVFSEEQYLLSLRDNADLLSIVQSDYKTKSILILGCSLDDEIDLKYAVMTDDGFDRSKNHRLFVTDHELDEDTLENLEDIAVSEIIVVDDYGSFYCSFPKSSRKMTLLDTYRFTGYIKNNDKDANINYFLGSPFQNNGNKIVKYTAMIERDIEHEKLHSIITSDTILVIGPRLSGKTTFLVNILPQLSSAPVFFFSSVIMLSVDFMNEICSLTNSVLVFDSNSISPDNTNEFKKILKISKEQGNKIIVAANKSDKLFMAFYTNLQFDAYIEIDKRPTSDERFKINLASEPFGIPKFPEKTSFIDNIATLSSSIFKSRKSVFPDIMNAEVSEQEVVLLILLASVGKVYYITLQHLGMSVGGVENIVRKYSPALELYDSDLVEVHMHSGLKVVANSRYWIINLLSSLTKTNRAIIIDSIMKIVKRLYFSVDSSYCAKQVILFDNLNAVFSVNDGAASLANNVYEKLQPFLNHEPDYWLQRAKSIRILSKRKGELMQAKEYAYKAYLDFEQLGKYSEKAVLTLAMISGKICRLDNYNTQDFVCDAIDWYYQALISEKNVVYSGTLVANARIGRAKDDLFCLVNYLWTNKDKFANQNKKVSYIFTQVIPNRDI